MQEKKGSLAEKPQKSQFGETEGAKFWLNVVYPQFS